MISYAAFLRGINVGGNAKVNMKELASLFEELGFLDVQTYVNSGNVIFSAKAGSHQKVIEAAITEKLGLTIRVMVKTKAELEDVVRRNPFTDEVIAEDRTLFVSFLFEPLPKNDRDEIAKLSKPEELIQPFEHEVYSLLVRQHFPDSFMGKSGLLKKFKADSTTRNWNTLTKVIAKM